jgi:hypothetical protein
MKSPKTITKSAKKSGTKNVKSAPKTIDPLYVIFEQHLFNFADPDSDRKTFIGNVVNDYLTYLRKNNIIVPKSLEQPIVEELGTQVNTMLVRKIYGCINLNEFADPVGASMMRSASRTAAKRRAKTRVAKAG